MGAAHRLVVPVSQCPEPRSAAISVSSNEQTKADRRPVPAKPTRDLTHSETCL